MTETTTLSSPVLHLRPHHLLCIQNYRGHGYSPGFHEKMTSVIALLQSADGAAIELTEGADDLCAACPHCRGHACESENPARFDKLVCEAAGAAPGSTFLWKLPCTGLEGPSISPMKSGGGLDRLEAHTSGVNKTLSSNYFTLPPMSKELLKSCCAGCSWLELCMEIVST